MVDPVVLRYYFKCDCTTGYGKYTQEGEQLFNDKTLSETQFMGNTELPGLID